MRALRGPVGVAVGLWATAAALFHLYTSGFGFYGPFEQRSLHLLWFLPLAYLLYPARKDKSPKAFALEHTVDVIFRNAR